MDWVVGGTWIGVAVFAIVVFGFCGYELAWKSKRLNGDLSRLNETSQQLTELQQQLAVVQRRVANPNS